MVRCTLRFLLRHRHVLEQGNTKQKLFVRSIGCAKILVAANRAAMETSL